MEYSASKDPVTIFEDASLKIFNNKYAKDCPINKCLLKDSTCANEYSKSDISLTKLKLAATMN